jgi:hypothetical protein
VVSINHFFLHYSLSPLPYVLCYILLTSTNVNIQSKPSFDIRKFPGLFIWLPGTIKEIYNSFAGSVYGNCTT